MMGKPFSEIKEKYIGYISLLPNNDFNFAEIFPDSSDISILIKQIDELRKWLDSFRPFNKEQAENLQQAFDLKYTYDSNKIEGNTLTLAETGIIINHGITIGGKSVKEHLEIINHQEAIEYIRYLAKNKIEFNERELKQIHSLILMKIDRSNSGRYRNIGVEIIGSKHKPPQPYLIDRLMEDYFIFYKENKKKLHPVLLASEMHERLATIHPFIDGNGRTSRLVMNLILLQNGFPITNISGENIDRQKYYKSLEKCNLENDKNDFYRFIIKNVKQSFYHYLHAVSGNTEEEEQEKGEYFYRKIQKYL